MGALVDVQIAPLSVRLAADLTCKRSQSRVGQEVALQLAARFEALAAVVADMLEAGSAGGFGGSMVGC